MNGVYFKSDAIRIVTKSGFILSLNGPLVVTTHDSEHDQSAYRYGSAI